MTFRYADYTKQITGAAIGTGAFVFTGTPTGFAAFSAIPSIANGDVVPYSAWDGAGNREVGWGTYNTGGSVTRTTVTRSTNGNALVNFTNPVTVWCDASAASLPLKDQNGALLYTVASGAAAALDITQTFNGGGAIAQISNVGTGQASSQFRANNATHTFGFVMHGTGFTTSGADKQDGGRIFTDGVGGICIDSSNASANIEMWIGGTRWVQFTNGSAQILAPCDFPNAVSIEGFGGSISINGNTISGGTPYGVAVVSNGSGGVQVLPGATSWSIYSSREYKRDIKPLSGDPYERNRLLKGYTFFYNEDAPGTARRIGLMYEDSVKALPEATGIAERLEHTDPKTKKVTVRPERKMLSLEAHVPHLVDVCNKLIDDVLASREEIAALRAELATLKARG